MLLPFYNIQGPLDHRLHKTIRNEEVGGWVGGVSWLRALPVHLMSILVL